MLRINLEEAWVEEDRDGGVVRHHLASNEGFALVSKAWLRAGWDAKYVYGFSWMGRPIIQLPEDMVRVQEAIYQVKPDVLIETGVAHGGSLVFYASLFKAMGKGRVVGIDIEIRPHNRAAIEAHEMFDRMTLIEGSSTTPEVVQRVRNLVQPGETVMVLLDSNHSKAHVLAELEAYAPLVTPGSYIVATDGIMGQLSGGAPRTQSDWQWNNPREAAQEFLETHPEFCLSPAPVPFNEGAVTQPTTYWPDGWLLRLQQRQGKGEEIAKHRTIAS
ncbi:Rhamnosyl O-methyltransferase [Gammaproteobacteria bacterium]